MDLSIFNSHIGTKRNKITKRTILYNAKEGSISYIISTKDNYGNESTKRFDNVFQNLQEQLDGDVRVYFRYC